MRELYLDHLPVKLTGLQNASRRYHGGKFQKGKPKSKKCRERMKAAYELRRQRGWKPPGAIKYEYHTPHGIMKPCDIAKFYKICVHTVRQRCLSDSIQFKNWYRIRIKN